MRDTTLIQDIAHSFATQAPYDSDLMYSHEWELFLLYKKKKGYYEEMSKKKMLNEIYKFVKAQHPLKSIPPKSIKDIYELLIWECQHQVEDMNTPYVALNDKTINLENFEITKHSRDRVATHHIPINAEDLLKPIPEWENFLKTTMVDRDLVPDEELVQVLQEMLGFYLIPEIKPHSVFFLVGQGGNGKSVLVDVLGAMIGERFTSAMSIQTLTTKETAVADLIGKKLNLCSEDESKYIKSDKFKALVAGDRVQARRMYEQGFLFRPRAKYLFATNDMPTFEGLNEGIRRRVNIVPFNKVFRDHEQDKELTNKLLKELGGIIMWALKGAERLRKNEYVFTKAKLMSKAKREFEEATSAVILFFNEEYEVTNSHSTHIDEIYKEYRSWCDRNGRKISNKQNFKKDLMTNVEGLENRIGRDGDTTSRRLNIKKIYADDEGETIDLEEVDFNA